MKNRLDIQKNIPLVVDDVNRTIKTLEKVWWEMRYSELTPEHKKVVHWTLRKIYKIWEAVDKIEKL